MPSGAIKHLFPGGNTSQGFFSYYSNIITPNEAEKIFIIKGGPGVGKSTFMKRAGEAFLQKGFDVEFLHCSSDNNSLDGIKIPKLKIAFIDGTSPHIVDPRNPGAVDEILNFGEFWDEKGIKAHKEDIIKTNKEIGLIFARAYKYLKAAYTVYEDSSEIYNISLDKGRLNLFTYGLIEDIFGGIGIATEEGARRSLFASAITPKGCCNHLDSIMTVNKVYEIVSDIGKGEEKILEKVNSAALERGFSVEAYYCALNPYKLEHLVIPGLDMAFTTSNNYHKSTVEKYASIDMSHFYNQQTLENYKDDLYQNIVEFDNLMSIALLTISRAKALHDRLETYYISNINFRAIDEFYDKIMARIMTDQ